MMPDHQNEQEWSDTAMQELLRDVRVPESLRARLKQIPLDESNRVAPTNETLTDGSRKPWWAMAAALAGIGLIAGLLFLSGGDNDPVRQPVASDTPRSNGGTGAANNRTPIKPKINQNLKDELVAQIEILDTRKRRIEEQVRQDEIHVRLAELTRVRYEMNSRANLPNRRLMEDQMSIAIYCASQYGRSLGLPAEYSSREMKLIIDRFPETQISHEARKQLGEASDN